ncbi:BQ2448_7179 [Microbotryum intermedium]|uniref:BQ2448_7179 protein n=1 Tax=Microbotryum intermedium TaxID=269621 RepID=A0A238FMY7_9BASI|nr:BQ2448_7179 [Microbotryum intermedium]
MLFASLTATMAISSSVLAVAASQDMVVASHLSLFRRADASETSSSYLANILGMASGSCASSCNTATADYTIAWAWECNQCANQTSQSSVASCACSAQSLGDLRTCASCIADSGNATAKSSSVSNYNSFVDLCVKDGLATVTGTVSVGQSTSAVPRATTASASSASRAVYTTAGSVSAVPVASLAGGSSTGTATGSAASAASATATPTATAKSGAGKLVSGGLGAVLVVALRLLA